MPEVRKRGCVKLGPRMACLSCRLISIWSYRASRPAAAAQLLDTAARRSDGGNRYDASNWVRVYRRRP